MANGFSNVFDIVELRIAKAPIMQSVRKTLFPNLLFVKFINVPALVCFHFTDLETRGVLLLTNGWLFLSSTSPKLSLVTIHASLSSIFDNMV